MQEIHSTITKIRLLGDAYLLHGDRCRKDSLSLKEEPQVPRFLLVGMVEGVEGEDGIACPVSNKQVPMGARPSQEVNTQISND